MNEEVWLHPSRFKPILSQPVLFQLLIASFLAMTAFTMMEGTIAEYLHAVFRFGPNHDIPYGMRQTSYYFAYIGVFIMYVQGRLMGQMVKKYGEWPVSIAGAMIVTLAMGLYFTTDFIPLLPMLLFAGAVNANWSQSAATTHCRHHQQSQQAHRAGHCLWPVSRP